MRKGKLGAGEGGMASHAGTSLKPGEDEEPDGGDRPSSPETAFRGLPMAAKGRAGPRGRPGLDNFGCAKNRDTAQCSAQKRRFFSGLRGGAATQALARGVLLPEMHVWVSGDSDAAAVLHSTRSDPLGRRSWILVLFLQIGGSER